MQSLALFVVLFGLLLGDGLLSLVASTTHWAGLVIAVVLGGLLALGSCTSNPPMPSSPKAAYPNPHPDICRPPFRGE
jgi:hypothetical protein